MGSKRRKRGSQAKLSIWWGLLILAVIAVACAAVDDFLKLNPAKPIPTVSTSK